MSRKHYRKRKKPSARILLARLLAVILVPIFVVLLVKQFKNNNQPEISDTQPEQQEEQTETNIETQMSEALLLECEKTAELVVYEQEVSVETTLSKTYFDWDILKKTKSYKVYGTGYYCVDLSKITSDYISVNRLGGVVKITIPDCSLLTVSPDFDKTEFQDTEKGLLAFGELKFTAEEQNEFEQLAMEALNEKLLSDYCMNKAKTAGLDKCKEVFKKVISEIDGTYVIVVKYAE